MQDVRRFDTSRELSAGKVAEIDKIALTGRFCQISRRTT
jgi:hypothetical protein